MKKTAWINCEHTPVRSGLYEVKYHTCEPFKALFKLGRGWFSISGQTKLTGSAAPGWSMMDKWRGAKK